MASTAVYATQVFAGEYPLPHDYAHRNVLPPASPTLVNTAHYSERSSVKLKIPNGSSNIVNSVVVDAVGRSLFSISSNSKRTTLVSCRNDVNVATIQWDRSSPRIVFGGKKMKCKDWLPRAGPETESRLLTHGGARYTWMNQSTTGYLIPANRPGLAVVRWRLKSRTDEVSLEIFQEALVESGLLEAIVISLVLLRSGRPLGDSVEGMEFLDSRFFALHNVGLNGTR